MKCQQLYFILTGLTNDDIDVFEINEAFASQAFYCVRELGIPADKVNPNGGAIAFGHPLGCTGARMISTLLYEMKRRKQRLGTVFFFYQNGEVRSWQCKARLDLV